jgi:hypothetical protein
MQAIVAAFKFLIHVVTGTLCVAAVAFAAFGLAWLGDWISGFPFVGPYIQMALKVVEIAALAADVFCALAFLVRTSVEFWRDLWRT